MPRSLREPVNAVTHSIGALLSVFGLLLLLGVAIRNGSPRQIIAFSIFGASLVAMYSVSTLYHGLPLSTRGIARARRLDHVMIYILIAGSYTPICLLMLPPGLGMSLLIVVWALAAVGTVQKLAWMRAPVWLSTALYLGMGWIAIIVIKPLLAAAPRGFFLWLLAGGLFYSFGAVVHSAKWAKNMFAGTKRLFGPHEIWHLFVMAGSFAHFWAIFAYASKRPG
jgi:hemolysin III